MEHSFSGVFQCAIPKLLLGSGNQIKHLYTFITMPGLKPDKYVCGRRVRKEGGKMAGGPRISAVWKYNKK